MENFKYVSDFTTNYNEYVSNDLYFSGRQFFNI